MTISGGNSVDLFLTQDSTNITYDRFRFESVWRVDTVSVSTEPMEDFEEFEEEE